MGELGKSLAFDEDAVQGLLGLGYGEPNTFGLLSLVYPGSDTTRRHVDHIYPQSLFTTAKLASLGFSPDEAAEMISSAQEAANLQLLTPSENESKADATPGAWLNAKYPDERDREAVITFHHLGELSDDLSLFPQFLSVRREKLAREIRLILGVTQRDAVG